MRTTLLYGCCAVSEQPAVCVWKRSAHVRGFFDFVALDHGFVPDAARGAILGDLLEEIVVRVEKEGKLRDELIHVHAAAHSVFDIFHTVAQSECQFLNRRRAGFADVVATDRNGVELGRVFDGKFKGVDHEAHRRFGRIDVFLLCDVFLEDVVLQSAGKFLPVRALFFRDGEIHRPDDRGRRIDGHRSRDVGERNFVEEHFHVGEGTDGHAALADFAFGKWVVGVVTHQRGQIERGREAGLALRQEVAKALIGVFGRAEAGELAHRPQPSAMHGGMNAAGVGRLTGEAQVAVGVPAGEIGGSVKTPDRISGNCGEFGLALGTFFERGPERVFFPSVFFCGRLARGDRSVAGRDGRGGSP